MAINEEVLNECYRNLANAVVEQACTDYIYLSSYLWKNPLTPGIEAKAKLDEVARENKIKKWKENKCKEHEIKCRAAFNKKVSAGKIDPKNMTKAMSKLEYDIANYRKKVYEPVQDTKEKYKLPRKLTQLGPYEEYKNCILGARASLKTLEDSLRNGLLNTLSGELDSDYIVSELKRKVYILGTRKQFPKMTKFDYVDLGINILKPRSDGGRRVISRA